MKPLSKATGEETLDVSDERDFLAVFTLARTEQEETGEDLKDLLGIDANTIAVLQEKYLPSSAMTAIIVNNETKPDIPKDQETLAVLLKWRGLPTSRTSLIWADIIARRCRQPHHLWQDLGFQDRAQLGNLMRRHFPRMVELNDQNMRWKKFFYRQICADSSFLLCLAPTCQECEEYDLCFGEETGAALL